MLWWRQKKQNKLPEAMQLQQLPTWGSIAQNFQLFFVKLWFLHVISPVKFTNRGVWISHCTWTAPRSTWRLRRELTPAQMSLGYTGEWFKTGVLNLFTVDFRRLLATPRHGRSISLLKWYKDTADMISKKLTKLCCCCKILCGPPD